LVVLAFLFPLDITTGKPTFLWTLFVVRDVWLLFTFSVVAVDVAAAVHVRSGGAELLLLLLWLFVDVVVVRARCCCSDFQVVVSA